MTMTVQNFLVKATIAILLSVLVTGCATTESNLGKEVDRPTEVIITKGMPAADLLAMLGEPKQIRPLDPPRDGFEVWVYSRQSTNVELKVTGTQEIPHVDPLTGMQTFIIDPIYNPESTTIKETTEFLIVNDQVADWKVERESKRDYL